VIPVLDARQMRAADNRAIRAGIPAERLMESAAAGLVESLQEQYPGWRRVLVACGPGNNGGDGLAAARMLARGGVSVSIFTLGDPQAYRGAAAANAERARAAGLDLQRLSGPRAAPAFRRALDDADGVVDALFGTGLTRALTGAGARAVESINRAGREVVAADVPSGLSSDTGELIGPSIRAQLTVAFAAAKYCHAFYPARERCGRLRVVPIGIPRRLLVSGTAGTSLVEAADLRRLLPPRRRDSHKGNFGRVAIVAGSRGKAGAAILAARGALRAGAGLVTVLCPETLEDIVVAALPEAMTKGLPEEKGAIAAAAAPSALEALEACDAAAVGPGLGTAPTTVTFLRKLLTSPTALVCDADALNAFAGHPGAFARRRRPTILTPHPGEAGRLLGTDSRRVQRDRPGTAQRLARRTRSVVLLKGAASLTANPAGQIRVNPTGSPLMSSAGSGDVLTGAIAALLAAGLDAEDAAYCGAFLHGSAGESLEAALGDAGLLAHELADALPFARDSLRGR
jgi:NAD(P)H-hydrate epimerase